MKRIIITEEQYNIIENNYSIYEQTENEKIFSKFLDMVKSYKSTPKEKDDEVTSSLSDTNNRTTEKLYSPLKNAKFPKNNFGVNRPGLDKPGKTHPGVDLTAASGTEVYSPQDGVVIDSAIRNDACGGTLYIDHKNGFKSRYCHLKEINVKVGDNVKVGQKVALSGGGKNEVGHGFSTGPHLHFELYLDGKLVDPTKYVKETPYNEDDLV